MRRTTFFAAAALAAMLTACGSDPDPVRVGPDPERPEPRPQEG